MSVEMDSPNLMTSRERYYMYNSLLCLAKAVEKRYTTIDLRNEITVTGCVKEVDGYMNIVLKDAAMYYSDNSYHYFPLLYVQARNIRNIHIPDNINMRLKIKEQVTIQAKPKKDQTKKKLGLKQSKLLERQAETLKLVKQMKKENERRKISQDTINTEAGCSSNL